MFRCPKCKKSDGPFDISRTVEVYGTVTVDASANVIDYSFNDNMTWRPEDEMNCNADCGYVGKVVEFEVVKDDEEGS